MRSQFTNMHEPYIPSTSVETSTSVQVPPVYTELHQPSPHILRTVPVSNFTAGISELDSNPGDIDQIGQQVYSSSQPIFSFWIFQIWVFVFWVQVIMDWRFQFVQIVY